jgi:hypothetical protein
MALLRILVMPLSEPQWPQENGIRQRWDWGCYVKYMAITIVLDRDEL